jgi:hypothetical protein
MERDAKHLRRTGSPAIDPPLATTKECQPVLVRRL